MPRTDLPETCFKELAAANWARHKLGTIAHELRVSQIAWRLFALTRKWHELGETESRLLTLAALVHDVGRAAGDKGHAKAGARLILEDTALPLSVRERRRLAFLTRYHRGKVPDIGAGRYLEQGHDDARVMRILLGLLRAADGLDSRGGEGSHLVATLRGRVVWVFGYVASHGMAEDRQRGKRKKFVLLESMLGCEVRLEWFSTGRLARVC